MKLYMKQKVFSWADKFTVKDEAGNDRYDVEGELFSWGKKLHIYDFRGNEVAFIQQKVFSFLPRFYVYVNGQQVAEIVKEFTFFRPRYRIDGLDWTIDGNFFAHDYEITADGCLIASIEKEWMTWGDCYRLDIQAPEDEIIALAVVLAIDCVMDSNSSASVSIGGD